LNHFIENTRHFLTVEITLHFCYWYFCKLLEANRHFRLEIDSSDCDCGVDGGVLGLC
jgi:hypothetical protein